MIGPCGNDPPFDGLLKPCPLEDRCFEQRCRRIGIVFKQLCRSFSVKSEIEAAIQAWIAAFPACRDISPERFRDFEEAEVAVIANRTASGAPFSANGAAEEVAAVEE